MKILVLQLKRIGDLILTTPALAALRQHLPQARIVLCVSESGAGLTDAMPFVDETLILRNRGSNAPVWARLALGQFDTCLDFTGTDRSAFFTMLSKAPRRVAFRWVQKSKFRPLFYSEFVDSKVREKHTIEHYLDLLQPLGIREHGTPVTLKLPDAARERADRLLKEAGIDGPFTVVHPGTARLEKYWLPERWAEVIDHCQGTLALPCVLTGTREPAEQNHVEAIRAALSTPFRDLTGKADLLTLAAIIERAHLLLSMDSAPMHLGSAFGTRQVSLFGETNPFHWRPLHDRAVVLLAGRQEPLQEFSPRFTPQPLRDLSTPAVIAAIASLL